jgi:hypothetical protein
MLEADTPRLSVLNSGPVGSRFSFIYWCRRVARARALLAVRFLAPAVYWMTGLSAFGRG